MKYLARRLADYLAARLRIEGLRLSRTVVLAAVTLAATAGGIPASAQSSDKANSIRGIVINQVTHAPVPRALVISSDQRFATLTDSEGRFEFALPQTSADSNGQDTAISAVFNARKPGFLPESLLVGTSAAAPGSEITLGLVPEAVLTGKVSLANAEAPDSITVEVYKRQVRDGREHWYQAQFAQSRSDGEYRVADLAGGTYKVLTREVLDRDPVSFDPQGQLYGYPPVYSQNAPDFFSSGAIRLSPGMTGIANLTVARKAYHRVTIPVTNAQPDTGLNVNVYVAAHKGPGFTLGYNNRSHSIEGMLPDGTYTVEAYGFANGPGAGTGMVALTVAGGPVRGPAMSLVPSGSLRVDVNEQFASADESSPITFNMGQRAIKLKGPRRYLNVTLEPADDSERGGVFSLRNPTGPGDEALVIESVRPGQYWVRVNSTRGYAASVRSGSVDLLETPLVVGPGSSPAPIEITMRDDTAQISGTVEGMVPRAAAVLQSGSTTEPATESPIEGFYSDRLQPMPVAPAHVYCIPLGDSGGQYAEVYVSPDGSFTSPPLAPGAYRVLAFDRPQPELEYRNPEAMQVYESRGPVVRVAGGQKENVHLQLISSSSLE
ncbi:MAG TPA: hypothetical protein VNW47_05430 [Terriglobales bacterium]|nr:hypothetical protein [Terriglobales bacterium]